VLAPLSQLLPELRNPELSGVSLQLDVDRAHFVEALVRLTLALAERSPVVLFLDDLQWADRTTLDWLVYAIRRWRENSTPILLLISLRDEDCEASSRPQSTGLIDWLTQVERELKPYHQELVSLSHADTIEMLLSILNPPLSDFAEWVFSETHGHPFYLMESLKDLLERRVLQPQQEDHGQWTFAVDSEHDLGQAVQVPSTARTVIQSRLSRLSPNAFGLLADASILEQHLTFEHLCAIANISHDLGLPALDELVSGRLLVAAAQTGDASTYMFANDMIRDVVYTEPGDARRRLFHRRALDFLEADRNSAPVLAHQAVAAGVAEAAFRHSLTAGQEALRLAAASEAQAHLEQARQLALESSPDSIEIESRIRDLYLQLAEAYKLNGQTQQAQAIYEDLHRLPPQFPKTSA
jgi:predicted ATPase